VGEGRGERRVKTRQTALNVNSIQIPFLSQPSRTCQVSLTSDCVDAEREAQRAVTCLTHSKLRIFDVLFPTAHSSGEDRAHIGPCGHSYCSEN